MEEYKKKYEEAMLRMNKWVEGSEITDPKEVAEFVFPELKESEDERIRKEIIQSIQDNMCVIHKDKCIAWLEKQREQKPVISDDALREGIAHFGITQYQIDNWLKKYVDIKKQGEQKTDKVESKFEVGDWINKDGAIWRIEGVNGKDYVLGGRPDVIIQEPIRIIDSEFHLWTIQDAKDGDVLAVNWQEGDDSWEKIIIFKKYHNKGVKGLSNAPCVEGYGNTFKNGELAFSEEVPYYSQTWTAYLHPTTKEQRDLLFQKMKEAGYEWDAEKKELKKIQKKSAWSEEDKKKIDLLIAIFEINHPNGQFKANPINTLNMECVSTEEIIDWLKSLKEKYAWKPSEEQMKALNYVINLMASSESPTENDYYYNVFKDLRTHLKKLREE